MAGKRLGLFKPHHSLFSSACIAPHRNIYFVPYQMKKKSYRERGIEGGIDRAYRESTKVCLKIPKGNIKSFSVKVCYFYLYLSLALFHHTYCLEGYHYARRRAGVKTICITTLTVWLQALCHDTLFQTIQPTIITLPPLCCTSLTHTHIDKHTHASSLIGSISCNTSTEVQEGQVCDEWREVQGGPGWGKGGGGSHACNCPGEHSIPS